jgi:ATP-binding cassette subfamily C protein CydC
VTDLRRLWQLFRPYWGWMTAGFVVSFVALAANVLLAAVSGWFITAMAIAGASGTAMNYFTPAAAIRASAIGRTAGRYLERVVNHEAALRQLAGLRVWFYRRLEPLAPARLQTHHSADLLSRIRADIDALDNLYIRILVPVLVAAAAIVCVFLITALLDRALALVLATMLAVAGMLVPLLARYLAKAPGRRLVHTEAELRRIAVDGTQGLSELLVYGAAQGHARRLDAASRALVGDQRHMARVAGLGHAAVGLSGSLALWLVLWLGIPLAQTGELASPQVAMLVLLTLAAFEAVAPLPLAFQQLETTLTAARRLFSIADTKPAVTDPPGPSPRPAGHSIEIRDLRFHYPEASSWSLNGIDLELPEGQRIALVGATGSGKSTLLSLLLGFHEADSGEIRLGGEPLGAFRGDDLRERITLVSQHTHLFAATVRDNLLLAAPDASQARLEQVCETAQIRDFIRSLPEGYDTWVGETGVRMSGGQARRIAIARALLRDAPILLLDEPTEGLDARTEHDLLGAVQALMEGRSTLLVTHRPSVLEAMDEILVLAEGRIVERGTHRELTAAQHYPRLLGLIQAD